MRAGVLFAWALAGRPSQEAHALAILQHGRGIRPARLPSWPRPARLRNQRAHHACARTAEADTAQVATRARRTPETLQSGPGRPPRLEPGAVIISSMRATASPAIGRKCSGRCSASTPRPYTLLWRTAGARSRQPCSSTGTAWPTYCAAPAATRVRSGRSGRQQRPGAAGEGRRSRR